jgi:hypothetical protein
MSFVERDPYTKNANLDLLDHPFPSCLGVNDKVIPYEVFNLRLVPWFMIEHLVIMLNPESPKCIPHRKCQLFIFLTNFVGLLFSGHCHTNGTLFGAAGYAFT